MLNKCFTFASWLQRTTTKINKKGSLTNREMRLLVEVIDRNGRHEPEDKLEGYVSCYISGASEGLGYRAETIGNGNGLCEFLRTDTMGQALEVARLTELADKMKGLVKEYYSSRRPSDFKISMNASNEH